MAQQGGGQQQTPLIRPEQVDNLPVFSPEQKQHYKTGLSQLWSTLSSTPAGSPQYQDAESKLRAASVKIMQQIGKGNTRPVSGGGPGAGQNQAQRPGVQQQQQNNGQNMQQQPSQQGQQPQQQNAQPGQGVSLSNQSRAELQAHKILIPPVVAQRGEVAVQEFKNAWYAKSVRLLQHRDQLKMKGQALSQQPGQNNSIEVNKVKQDLHNLQVQWEHYKNNQMNPIKGLDMQRQPSQQGGSQQQANGGQGQQQGVNGATQQQQTGDVKMNMDHGPSQSPSQLQNQFQHPQQQPQGQTGPSPVQQQGMQQPTSAHPQQTPQSATQPQMPQNFQQQGTMPQQQQQPGQQRPPMNPQQIQQNMQNMQNMQQMGQQQQGTPTSAVPQSATQSQMPQQMNQQQQQRPQALSHDTAMARAAENYRNQTAQQQQQQQQQNPMQHMPNGSVPLNGPPSATTQTPTNAFPMQQPGQQPGSANTKFPIAKQLNLDARTQMPQPGPPARPTYATPGMMNQPGVQRPAPFTLEGEGDRVLSKKKLDELVRQVTGSTSSDSMLAPDTEEMVLSFADEFVDNVLTAACKLAKLRSGQALDIRDIQIVLERNYGIRIPGYGLDEVRTVRKFQPSEGWRNKMQAVQAGKVMGGGNKDRET